MPYYTYLLHSEKKSSESWELHWETKILDPVNSEYVTLNLKSPIIRLQSVRRTTS